MGQEPSYRARGQGAGTSACALDQVGLARIMFGVLGILGSQLSTDSVPSGLWDLGTWGLDLGAYYYGGAYTTGDLEPRLEP